MDTNHEPDAGIVKMNELLDQVAAILDTVWADELKADDRAALTKLYNKVAQTHNRLAPMRPWML
jgi:hypothetical protein